MATVVKPITERERSERRARVERAVASVGLEGLEPSDAAKAVFDRYVDGDLTVQEIAAAIGEVNAREFGPVHVPGD